MNDTKYNGWTNYATWRVNLEMFDGMEVKDNDWLSDPSSLKDYAEQTIYELTEESIDVSTIARDYALAFLSDVNWYEIAKHYHNETEEA